MSIRKMKNSDDSWLVHYKGFEEFAKRYDKLADVVVQRYSVHLTPFLDSAQQRVLQSVVGNRCILRFGGGSEKKRALLMAMDFEEDFEVCCLRARFHRDFHSITHRDVLGALVNCGMKPDQFGDIIVEDGMIYVMVVQAMADVIIHGVDKIKRAKVCFERFDGVVEKQYHIEYRQVIVSNHRLDQIVASCINSSRSKAQALIKGGKVSLDHLPLEDCSLLCNNNAVISIRGYGRFVFRGLIKKTKADHWVAEIGRYC